MSTQIKEFCDKHAACRGGREWALTHCEDMNEVWQTARPEWLEWVATRKEVLTENELRRFAVWSARQVQHLMTDDRSLNALDVAERYANGAATDEELAAAHAAAYAADAAAYAAHAAHAAAARAADDAARAASYAAANAAARAAYAAADAAARAAYAAADAAARAAYAARVSAHAARATPAADAAAVYAAHAAACAAYDAVRAAAESAQAQWLRENTKPNFA